MRIITIVFLFSFFACNQEKTQVLAHVNPNKNVSINIEGHKDSYVGPWTVDMKFKAYNFKESKITFELYADEISEKTISFTWQDETHCLISFKQSDDKLKEFKLTAAPNNFEVISVD